MHPTKAKLIFRDFTSSPSLALKPPLLLELSLSAFAPSVIQLLSYNHSGFLFVPAIINLSQKISIFNHFIDKLSLIKITRECRKTHCKSGPIHDNYLPSNRTCDTPHLTNLSPKITTNIYCNT